MIEREVFLKALAENEDDSTTRLIYSDWLDEQGEYEEANRQRNWTASKAWLIQFCRENNPDPNFETFISYEDLLERGRDAIESDGYLSCGSNETMCDALRSNHDEFWKHWSIVTGVPLPRNLDGEPDTDDLHTGCSC